jgi:hypothetical protein
MIVRLRLAKGSRLEIHTTDMKDTAVQIGCGSPPVDRQQRVRHPVLAAAPPAAPAGEMAAPAAADPRAQSAAVAAGPAAPRLGTPR